MRARAGQLDVSQTFTAHARQRHFDAALVANHAAVFHTRALTGQALRVGNEIKYPGAEQSIALRLEGPVVDRFRLGDFAMRPASNLFRRCEADPDGIEVGDQICSIVRRGSVHEISYESYSWPINADKRRLSIGRRQKSIVCPTFLICVYLRSSAAHNSLVCRERGVRYFPRLLHQLDVQTERLQLAYQDVEGFGHARLGGRFTLHDRFVNLGASVDVVGLCRQQFLKHVRCDVGFMRPDFHFAEALSAELGFAAQRLLGNERVRTDGAGMDLVVHQVRELEHVDVAHRDRLFESLPGDAIPKLDLAGTRQ